MNPIIRAAAPQDVDFIAWIMLTAGRSHVTKGGWELLIEGEERCTEFLRGLAGARARSYCHHSVFTLAEVDGSPAGGLCAYDAGRFGMQTLVDAVREVFASMGLDQRERERAAERMAPFLLCAPIEPQGVWILESVAMLPRHRRRGLTRRLLEHKLEQGRQRGFRHAQISILIGNEPAQRAYEAVGFRVAEQKRHPDFEAALGAPGVARMTISL